VNTIDKIHDRDFHGVRPAETFLQPITSKENLTLVQLDSLLDHPYSMGGLDLLLPKRTRTEALEDFLADKTKDTQLCFIMKIAQRGDFSRKRVYRNRIGSKRCCRTKSRQPWIGRARGGINSKMYNRERVLFGRIQFYILALLESIPQYLRNRLAIGVCCGVRKANTRI
jgi:hypothetical protein